MEQITRSISDLGAAAYLLMHGHKVKRRDGKEFVFSMREDEVEEFEQRKLDYLSSEFHRFDSYIMSLKKM